MTALAYIGGYYLIGFVLAAVMAATSTRKKDDKDSTVAFAILFIATFWPVVALLAISGGIGKLLHRLENKENGRV